MVEELKMKLNFESEEKIDELREKLKSRDGLGMHRSIISYHLLPLCIFRNLLMYANCIPFSLPSELKHLNRFLSSHPKSHWLAYFLLYMLC